MAKNEKKPAEVRTTSARAMDDVAYADPGTALVAPQAAGETALEVYDYGDDAGAGNEARQKNDNLISVYRVLQGLSPQVQDRKRAVRAEAGDWYNTATDTTISADVEYDDVKAPGLLFQPVAYKTVIGEWIPKDKYGGGFVANYEPGDPRVSALLAAHPFGKIEIPEGGISGVEKTPTELVEDKTMFGYRLDPETLEQVEPIVLHFSSMKIKPWKAWLNLIAPAGVDPRKVAPIWANVVRIKTKLQEHNGNQFFNVVFTPLMNPKNPRQPMIGPADPRYVTAKRFRDDVMAGKAKEDVVSDMKATGGGAAEGDSPF